MRTAGVSNPSAKIDPTGSNVSGEAKKYAITKDTSLEDVLKWQKDGHKDYDYLLKMPIYNLTKDKIDEFNTNLENKESEYNKLLAKDNKQLWIDDLTLLEPKLSPFKINKKLKFKFKVKAKSSK